ncbi:DUF4148 domain-containing protein [Paraburkholderia sp.]|uniref:DUF4148 domain-containing protein n=1 Tax=Paraburkholderia sp. TaxID=1926495 RepID=UPI002D6BC1E9|nr:DUF4148 domain-containing protein [Paraburkholderia sp.]HZZ03334.1 DUF4148 domain-containing protein [Paraburkholderia sp.]
MKLLIQAVVAAVLAAPVASFAEQPKAPMTRAQVRAELVQLERAGYNPAKRDDAIYPADLQAAEARVASQNYVAQAASTGVGGVVGGVTQSGRHAAAAMGEPLYGHH